METRHEQIGDQGIFYMQEEANRVGQLFYLMRGTVRMIIDHTEVDDRLTGRGIGKQLVQQAVDYARKHKLKIMPICSFAKSVLLKSDAYKDVLS